jgi:hypothetical protein
MGNAVDTLIQANIQVRLAPSVLAHAALIALLDQVQDARDAYAELCERFIKSGGVQWVPQIEDDLTALFDADPRLKAKLDEAGAGRAIEVIQDDTVVPDILCSILPSEFIAEVESAHPELVQVAGDSYAFARQRLESQAEIAGRVVWHTVIGASIPDFYEPLKNALASSATARAALLGVRSARPSRSDQAVYELVRSLHRVAGGRIVHADLLMFSAECWVRARVVYHSQTELLRRLQEEGARLAELGFPNPAHGLGERHLRRLLRPFDDAMGVERPFHRPRAK